MNKKIIIYCSLIFICLLIGLSYFIFINSGTRYVNCAYKTKENNKGNLGFFMRNSIPYDEDGQQLEYTKTKKTTKITLENTSFSLRTVLINNYTLNVEAGGFVMLDGKNKPIFATMIESGVCSYYKVPKM